MVLKGHLPFGAVLPSLALPIRTSIYTACSHFEDQHLYPGFWPEDGTLDMCRKLALEAAEQDQPVLVDEWRTKSTWAYGQTWWCCETQAKPPTNKHGFCRNGNLGLGMDMLACGQVSLPSRPASREIYLALISHGARY